MTSTLSFPLSLLLLIHLHILDFPQANNSEYDQNLFDPLIRGLRDRAKSMEDICYFLVSKLERREQVKWILPIYPCLQPPEIVAFRTSLGKYLETLRHQSIRPVADEVKAKSTHTDPNAGKEIAWWWKDVIPSKSLLQECSGERFQRLMVSFSTHVLQHMTGNMARFSGSDTGSFVRSQSSFYASLLASCQSTRRRWNHSASLVLWRENDITTLRNRLYHEQSNPSMSNHLSTEKLKAAVESKLRQVAKGDRDSKALRSLFDLAGIGAINDILDKSSNTISVGFQLSQFSAVLPPPPLPIAAARHPSHLRKLRAPLFGSSAATDANPIASFLSDEEALVQRILRDALERVKRIKEELNACLAKMTLVEAKEHTESELRLWQSSKRRVHHNKLPTPDLLSSFSLPVPTDSRERTERRIGHIRDHELTPFPAMLGSSSRKPRPSSHAFPLSVSPLTPHSRHAPKSTKSVKGRSPRPRKAQARVSFLSPVGKERPARRKSQRFSVGIAKRRPPSSQPKIEEENEAEIDRIIDAVGEHSTSLQEVFTPKPGTRIITSGSTIKKSKQQTPRISFVIPDRKSLVPLPDPDWSDDEQSGTSDTGDPEGNSVTLRDILLKAGDLAQFDLMGGGGQHEGLLDESFDWE